MKFQTIRMVSIDVKNSLIWSTPLTPAWLHIYLRLV